MFVKHVELMPDLSEVCLTLKHSLAYLFHHMDCLVIVHIYSLRAKDFFHSMVK